MHYERFKERLEGEKKELEHQLTSVGRRNPNFPTDFEPVATEKGVEADPVDQADTITSFETNAAILNDLELRYESVLAALTRLEEGNYGICKVNGEPIEEERLEANPAADTCIAHAQ